jgi:hypothetical protein
MDERTPTSEGERLAERVRRAIQRHGLLAVVTARYVPARGKVALVSVHGPSDAVEVDASEPDVGRLELAVAAIAEARRAGRIDPIKEFAKSLEIE